MHTLHYWAVEAEDRQQAFSTVKERLINEDGTNWVEWSDWHVVGGGRWSKSQYENSPDEIISYSETPDKFNETIKMIKQWRTEEMNRCLSEIKTDRFTSDMVDFISEGGLPNKDLRFSMNNYYIKKASDLLQDNYSADSSFYDLKEFTAHMGYLQERLDNPATSALQFLVPVDFHF